MALLTKLKIQGRVEELRLRASRDTGFEKAKTGTIRLSFDGPEGDCHTGPTRKSDSRTLTLYPRNIDIRNVRQLTVLSAEELAEIASQLAVPGIDPGWFGANIVTSGIADLTLLPPSTRLQFPSGATIVVDMENLPCSQIAAVVGQHHPEVQMKLVKAATHKRGVTAWVERQGDISVHDAITIILPPQRVYLHTG
jgi:MOSC domain